LYAFFDDRQWLHDPKHFMAHGVISENPEKPQRINILHKGTLDAGCIFQKPKDFGVGPISAIHSPRYLTFLRSIYHRWQYMEDAGAEVIPNIHPLNRTDSYPKSTTGQSGFHQADTACPIGEHTWDAAYWSAQSALGLAEHVLSGAQSGYALCRPPGHHAFGETAGGFCFMNNSAIAAQHIRQTGKRVAILDIDVHHGNGTQNIFYDRDDVLTISLHADTARFYPFFWGNAHERGSGRGSGFNLNIPMPRHTADATYLDALKMALEHINLFGADVIVVALGLDASIHDPFEGLAITTGGFQRIAEAISDLGRPMALVQEGGYLSDELGQNLCSFLAGVRV
jgi:acetoin utilization deacetylase AcuC-like enzyme